MRFRDAHVPGRELVLARCLHRDAELRAIEEHKEQTGQDDGHDDDQDLVEPEHQGAECGVHPGERTFQHLRLVAPDRAGDEAQHEADRDGEDHHRDLRLPEDVAQDRTLKQPADRGHGEDCANAGEPERQAQVRVVAETDRDEGAEHHHVALRKVDLLGGLVDQHEPQGDQTVDAPVGEAADDELKVLQTRVPDRSTICETTAHPVLRASRSSPTVTQSIDFKDRIGLSPARQRWSGRISAAVR